MTARSMYRESFKKWIYRDSSGKEQDGGADVFETLGSPLCQSYTCVLKLANFVNLLGHPFKPQVIANEGEWVWHSRMCCM